DRSGPTASSATSMTPSTAGGAGAASTTGGGGGGEGSSATSSPTAPAAGAPQRGHTGWPDRRWKQRQHRPGATSTVGRDGRGVEPGSRDAGPRSSAAPESDAHGDRALAPPPGQRRDAQSRAPRGHRL